MERIVAVALVSGIVTGAWAKPTVIDFGGTGPLLINVIVEGKPLRFLFDTALPGDGRIDADVAKEIGLASGGVLETDADGNGIPLVKAKQLSVGGIDIGGVTLWSLPLGALAQPPEQRIDGAIGWQLLKGRVYTVDAANRKLIIDDEPLTDAKAAGTIELDPKEQSPSVPAVISGKEMRATLNSGNMMGMVLPLAMMQSVELTKEPWPSGKIGNGQAIKRGRLKTPMTIAGLSTGATGVEFLSVWEAPNMGLIAMEPYAFTFDLVNNRLRVARPDGQVKPLRYGVAFDSEQQPPRIVRIFDGSIAEKAGLLEGDAIRSINGVETRTQPEILAAMRAGKVTIVVEREGQTKTIEMSRE
ncbi:MAG: PDZ domain-containing protein [Phycisphaerales bacterium]|nr:aspartyl protease family protein [Planctomycetota bacterium]